MTVKSDLPQDRPLISNATILILSGFLIGLTVGKIVAEDLSPYTLSCGLAGLVSYIALEHVAARRRAEEEFVERAQNEDRLEKHVLSLSSVGFSLPSTAALPQATRVSHEERDGLFGFRN